MTTENVDEQGEIAEVAEETAEPVTKEADHLERIFEANRERTDCTIQVQAAASTLKLAKSRLERADEDLQSAIRDTGDMPLFDQSEEGAGREGWKLVPLSELGINGVLAEKLAEESIETLGQLNSYRAVNNLTTIKGVGDGAVQKIDDAVEKYFDDHPEHCPEEPEEGEEVLGAE